MGGFATLAATTALTAVAPEIGIPMSLAAGIGTAANGAVQMMQRAADVKSQNEQDNYRLQALQSQEQAREQQRVNLLQQNQATQRARFGGMGIGSSDGSASALLDGLTSTTDAANAADAQQTSSAMDALTQGMTARGQRNLLQDEIGAGNALSQIVRGATRQQTAPDNTPTSGMTMM